MAERFITLWVNMDKIKIELRPKYIKKQLILKNSKKVWDLPCVIRHRKFYWFRTFCTISIDEKSSGCRRQDCKNGYSSDKHTFGTFFNIKKTKQTIKVGSSKIHLWQCLSWKFLGFGYYWYGHEWYSRLHSLQGVLLKFYTFFYDFTF